MKFAKSLCCFELGTFVFILVQLRLDEAQENSCGFLVDCSVVEETPLDQSNELTFNDGRAELLLGQLEDQLQGSHVIILFHLEQKQQGLVLDVAVS